MEVRIKFDADLVITGETMAEVREKFESMELWSQEAKDCGVEFSEIELVEDAETYNDVRHDYDHCFDNLVEETDEEECWSVWVGGGEVNDYYLTRKEAEKLAEEYRNDGYDDVVIDKAGE